jgi:hypothetical protein
LDEDLKPYVKKEKILWKGKPLYFAKTSGTTSQIPLSKESMPYHIEGSKFYYTYMKQVRLICRRKNDFSAKVLFWKKTRNQVWSIIRDCSTFYSQISRKIGCLLGKLI